MSGIILKQRKNTIILQQTGRTGPQGPQGPAGEGVPTGGTTGEVLTKLSNADFDTEWEPVPSAPVTSVNGYTGAVTLDTDDITEGTSLYFTSARAINALTGQNVSIFSNDAGYIAGVDWGDIGGTLSNQTDLQTALDGKLDLTGGTLSGSLTIEAASFQPLTLTRFVNNANGQGFRFIKSRGSSGSPAGIQSGDQIARFMGTGYIDDGSLPTTGVHEDFLTVHATQNWTSTARGREVRFRSVPNDGISAVDRLIIHNDGNTEVTGDLAIGNQDTVLYRGSAAAVRIDGNFAAGSTDGSFSTGFELFRNALTGRIDNNGDGMRIQAMSTGHLYLRNNQGSFGRGMTIRQDDTINIESGVTMFLDSGSAFEINHSDGIVMQSADGTRWQVQVDNTGSLTTTSL